MPVYNAGQYLNESITSVLNQSYPNWELLIVDDGSTDFTKNIIDAVKDSRIRYFCQKHQGVSAARNVGLANMSGEYFCFVDADDVLPIKSLASRLQVFNKNINIDFVDGSVTIFDQNLAYKKDIWKPSFRGNPRDELLHISDSCFFGLTWMIRRDKNKSYHFHYHLTHGEDLLFYLELATEGGKYDFVEESILHYRKGHSSAMKNLKGLETGYHNIYQLIQVNEKIPDGKVAEFKRKAKRIIFKSYLGHFQPYNSLSSFFKNW